MTLDEKQLLDRLAFARRAAREAGAITLEHFQRHDLLIERKADDSPVTVADRAAEEHLRSAIAQQFPEDGILGEEFGEVAGSSGLRWILDPIDGTKSFIHGVPLYTTLVGVELEQRGVVGVIYAPATGEMVSAARGQGAFYQKQDAPPQAARVSVVDDLGASLFLTSEVRSFATDRTVDATDIYLRLQNASRLARTWGDAYGYMMVATGRAELMVDPVMNVWDAAALQPVLEEAGGTFTDWKGNATIHAGEGIGSNGLILGSVLDITGENR